MIWNLDETGVNTTSIPYVHWYMHIGSGQAHSQGGAMATPIPKVIPTIFS